MCVTILINLALNIFVEVPWVAVKSSEIPRLVGEYIR